MKPTCQTCAHWGRLDENYLDNDYGRCDCEKFWYDPWCDKKPHPSDGFEYYDYDGFSAGFYSGSSFGCIHHKPNPKGVIK